MTIRANLIKAYTKAFVEAERARKKARRLAHKLTEAEAIAAEIEGNEHILKENRAGRWP